jgi:hypothetical protein
LDVYGQISLQHRGGRHRMRAEKPHISLEDIMKAKTIALTISLVFVSVALGYQTDAHMGTWKLNEAKSKFAGKARNHTVVYEAAGDQTIYEAVLAVKRSVAQTSTATPQRLRCSIAAF